MSATARVAVERVPNVILIPAEASFQKKAKRRHPEGTAFEGA
jgi:hypothetical protein